MDWYPYPFKEETVEGEKRVEESENIFSLTMR
jgi:hypothetical protein